MDEYDYSDLGVAPVAGDSSDDEYDYSDLGIQPPGAPPPAAPPPADEEVPRTDESWADTFGRGPVAVGHRAAEGTREYFSEFTSEDADKLPKAAELGVEREGVRMAAGAVGAGEGALDIRGKLIERRIASFANEESALASLEQQIADGIKPQEAVRAYFKSLRETGGQGSKNLARMLQSPLTTPRAVLKAVELERVRIAKDQRRRDTQEARLESSLDTNFKARETLGEVNDKLLKTVGAYSDEIAALDSQYATDMADLAGGITQAGSMVVGAGVFNRVAAARSAVVHMSMMQASGYSYAEDIRDGKSIEDAFAGAMLAGLSERVGERFALDKILGSAGGRGIRAISMAWAAEAGNEGVTETLNILGRWGLFDETLTADEAIRRVFRASAIGGFTGASLRGVVGGQAEAGINGEQAPPQGELGDRRTDTVAELTATVEDESLDFADRHDALVELERVNAAIDPEMSGAMLDYYLPIIEQAKARDEEATKARDTIEAELDAEQASEGPLADAEQNANEQAAAAEEGRVSEVSNQGVTTTEPTALASRTEPADGAVDDVLDRYGFVTGFRTSEVLNDPSVSLDSKLEQVDRAAATLLDEDPQLAARFRREMYGVLQEQDAPTSGTIPVNEAQRRADREADVRAAFPEPALETDAEASARAAIPTLMPVPSQPTQSLEIEAPEGAQARTDGIPFTSPNAPAPADADLEAQAVGNEIDYRPTQPPAVEPGLETDAEVDARLAGVEPVPPPPAPLEEGFPEPDRSPLEFTPPPAEGGDVDVNRMAELLERYGLPTNASGRPLVNPNAKKKTRAKAVRQLTARLARDDPKLARAFNAEVTAMLEGGQVDADVAPFVPGSYQPAPGTVSTQSDLTLEPREGDPEPPPPPTVGSFDEYRRLTGDTRRLEEIAADESLPIEVRRYAEREVRPTAAAADAAGRELLDDDNQVMFARSRRRLGSKHPSIESLPDDQKEVSSVPLLDSEQDLERLKTAEITSYLQKRSQGALGGARNEKTPENLERVAQLLAAETQYAVAQPGNARQWYGEAIKRAQRAAASVFPEIGTSQWNRTAFNYALAVTSNGQKVDLNAKQALQVYQQYRETGVMPVFGNGERTQAMKDHFRLFNRLTEELGQDGFMRFLNTQFTVKELTSAGFDVTGDNMGQLVPGSAILGPKIGGAFFANLQGNRNTLTMDLWFMRTWGRMTGSLKLDFEAGRVRNNLVRMRRALQKESERAAAMGVEQADIDLALSKPNRPSTADELNAPDAALLDIANDIYDQWQLGGHKDPDEFYRSSRELHKAIVKAVETPGSGSDRQFMRDTVQRAVGILGERGIGTTAADMQALLWYGEKDLYAKFGSGNTGRTDYEGGIKKGIEELGLAGDANVDGGGQSPAGQVTGRDRIGGKASSFTPRQRERFLEQQRARQVDQRLSAEIEPGEGATAGFTGYDQLTAEQKQQVTTAGVKDAFKKARSITKARGKVRIAGAGGFLEWVAPSVQMDLSTTVEQARDTADAMGYLMRQTGVWVSRPDKNGTSTAIDITHPELASDSAAKQFWDHIRDMDPMLAGYAPIPKKGRNAQGGVRLLFPSKYHPDLAKLKTDTRKLAAKLDRAATAYFGSEAEVDTGRVHLDDQENDWNVNPEGREYVERLVERHGSEVQGRLDDLRARWEEGVQEGIDRALYPERFQDPGAGQADAVEPKARRTTRPRGGSLASEVRAQVRAIDKGLKAPLPTTVVQSYEDIPAADRKRVEAAGLTEFDAVFLPTPDGPDVGKVIMVADKLRDPEAVERIYLRHESNHGGLRRLAGPKLTPLMLAAYNDNKQAMDEWAAEAGVDTSKRSGKLTAAEEFIVEMAERGETNSLMQNVFATVRDYLRRAGFKLQLTDSDLRLLVAQAGKQISEGRSWVPEGAIRYGESLQVFTERGTGQPMYARTKPPEWIGDEDATRDKFRETIQDRMISLRRLEERVEKLKGSPLTEAERAYLMEERFHGRAGHQVEQMERNLVNPITDAMRAGDLSLEQVGEFLHARTAVETNTQMAKINARALAQRRVEKSVGAAAFDAMSSQRKQKLVGAELAQVSLSDPDLQNLSGMSNAEALQVLMRAGGNPHLNEIAQHVDRMTATHRQRLLDQGLVDQQTITNWTTAYKRYVPLHRDMEGDTAPLPGSGQRFQVAGRESQFRKGSTIPVKHDEILSHLISQHATGIVRAEKNIVGKGLLELAKNNPDPEYWDVGTQFTVEEPDGKAGVRRFKKPASAYRQDDSAFIVKVDGVEHAIRFKTEGGKRVAAAMKGIGAERMGRFGQGMSRVMRHLSFVNTSFSLPFIPTNYIRDFSAAAINLQGSLFSKGGGSKAMVMLQAMPGGPAMLGIADYQLRKDKATHPWAKVYKEFLETGGGTSWANAYNSIEQLTGTLEAEAKRSATSPVRALTAFMKAVEGANTVAESAVRLSLYKNATDAKFTPTQAASMAKNITINFNRKGTRGTWLNNYTLFFNASVQGSQVLLSNARRPQVKVAMAGIAALGAFLSILNRVNGGEDEEGVNRYDKIPDWERNNNLILMDWRPGHEGEYFKMPLPYGYNVLHVAGDALGGAASSAMGLRRDFKVTQEAGRLLEAFTDAFSPVGSPVTPGQLLSPTLGDPLMRIIENKDYAGRDLAPKKNPYKDEPNYHRAWQSTWPIYSDIAEFLNNDVGRGDPVTPSFEIFGFRPFDMSPEWISGLVEFGLGSGGMALVKGGRRMALGDETPPGVEPDPLRQTIFERRFRGVENRYATRTLFFDALKDVEQTVERTELMRSEPELARSAKKTPQYRLRTKAKDARSIDKKLWTKIKAIQENDRISDEEKDRRIRRERAKQERNYHRFNKWYMDAVHPRSTNSFGDFMNSTFREAA